MVNLEVSRELIAPLGVSGDIGDAIIFIAALADILLGVFLWLALWYRRIMRGIVLAQIMVMIIYTIILSIMIPEYWLHPFAPIIKNLAMWIMAMYLLIEEKNNIRSTYHV